MFGLLSTVAGLYYGKNCTRIIAKYPAKRLDDQALFLRGNLEPLSWDKGLEMTQTAENQYEICVDFARPEEGIEFKTLIRDKLWQLGASIYPWFYSRQGRYEYIRNVWSSTLKNRRDLVVYLPPSYDENTEKPYDDLLVMHDGQNLFNDSTSFAGVSWRVQDTVDQMIIEGNISELMILGIDNTANRIDEYTYSIDPDDGGGNADAYLDFIEDTVIPTINTQYSRLDSQRRLGMIGSSLGGLCSCYAAWSRPHVYKLAGCMSSSFWWNSKDFQSAVLDAFDGPPHQDYDYILYLDSGDRGDAGGEAQIALDSVQVLHEIQAIQTYLNDSLTYYLDHGGEHSEYYWGQRFNHPMSFLYGRNLPSN